MTQSSRRRATGAPTSLMQLLAEQGLSRAGGASLVRGNDARILRDAGEHLPAFLAAIGAAKRTVQIENYIFADDSVGRQVASALAKGARESTLSM